MEMEQEGSPSKPWLDLGTNNYPVTPGTVGATPRGISEDKRMSGQHRDAFKDRMNLWAEMSVFTRTEHRNSCHRSQ